MKGFGSECLLLSILFPLYQCANILVVLPYKGTSHFLVFKPLLDELAARGHNLTVASFFPKTEKVPNYTDVSLTDGTMELRGFFEFGRYENNPTTTYSNMKLIFGLCDAYERLFTIPNFMALLDRKFDLVITEVFNSDVMLGFVYRLGAPYILFSTSDYFPWHSYSLGNSVNPSYVPHALSLHGSYMNLQERFMNAIETYASLIAYQFIFRHGAQKMAEKYLGPLPPLNEIARNATLVFVHSHFSLHGLKSEMPNSIQIGGLNIPKVKPLPKDLKKIMDESNGVVYFCMGSVLKGDSLSEQKQKAFIKVFSELKLTVLWKREAELEKKVDNIVTSSWFPQRDVLAHPKVRLFISHCGLLGTNEAIASAVPMIGIPMFGDQHHNAKAIESIGVGIYLDFNELNEDVIRNAVHTVLNDPSYKENANKVSAAFLDRPMSPLDTAVYWVEYVIRHKGAPHLRSAARDLTWYEYHNLDVLLIFLIILYVTFLILKTTVKLIIYLIKPMFGSKKVKVN